MNETRKEHHFVPQLYLKPWTNEEGRIWRYRLLVSTDSVPSWGSHTPRAIARQKHLYTQMISRNPQDEVERWFAEEFESPAVEPIHRAVTEQRLTSDDWAHVIRFLALQDVRTPARLLEMLKRWNDELPTTIDETLRASVAELELLRKSGELSGRRSNVEDPLCQDRCRL